MGVALEGVPRQAYYLHTKVGRYTPDVRGMFDFSRERVIASVDESLARLRVQYLDCVQGASLRRCVCCVCCVLLVCAADEAVWCGVVCSARPGVRGGSRGDSVGDAARAGRVPPCG
jgi:hypothetical protein